MSGERQLLQRVMQGDIDAFTQLVQKHQARLIGSLTQIIGSQTEAEDVAQEAFLRAYQNLERFRGESAFYSWLYRIAMNRWISRQRKRRPSISLNDVADAEQWQTPATPTPLESLQRDEQARIVQQGIHQLPEEHRVLIVMREFDQFDYETISEVLQLPIGTVRSRLHRARLKLKEILASLLSNESNEPIEYP